MKTRKLTLGLLALTAGIWGVVLLRVARTISGDQTTSVHPIDKTGNITKSKSMVDTFALLPVYDDPFRRSPQKRNFPSTILIKKTSAPTVLLIPKIVESSPQRLPLDSVVVYLGSIANASKSRKVAVLKVNGREHLLSEGQTVEGIKLIEQREDSVKAVYERKTMWLKRSI